MKKMIIIAMLLSLVTLTSCGEKAMDTAADAGTAVVDTAVDPVLDITADENSNFVDPGKEETK